MKVRIFLLLILFFAICKEVKSADWKFIGGSIIYGENYYGFYDEETKERRSNGNIVVWIKYISVQQIDSITNAKQDTLGTLAVKKLLHKYYPPYAFIQSDTSFNAMLGILQKEVAINNFRTITKLMMRTEFDCKHRKSRGLSTVVYNDIGGVENSSATKNEWSDIVPESSGESMLKVLCSKY
jgi:hypothetical protein